jgi:hypothetical protein
MRAEGQLQTFAGNSMRGAVPTLPQTVSQFCSSQAAHILNTELSVLLIDQLTVLHLNFSTPCT